jgi:2-dehydropantoate 2-reductase
MTTIALIGPGAIGGTLATWLGQREDIDLTVCVRTPFERLVLETPDGEVTASPRLATSPEGCRRSTGCWWRPRPMTMWPPRRG